MLKWDKAKGMGSYKPEGSCAAQQNPNGLELAERSVQVSALSDQIGMVDMGVHRGEFDDDE
uniref:Uncharacterized protein n=1 Tax=Physcomitrium patens TaxID=3218 RepID=A0A2K1IP68_PHYPA|nr:hypothetical protein PHYPA_027391 [Physcomitrium patens]